MLIFESYYIFYVVSAPNLKNSFVIFGRETKLSGKDLHPLATPQGFHDDPRIRLEALLEVLQTEDKISL